MPEQVKPADRPQEKPEPAVIDRRVARLDGRKLVVVARSRLTLLAGLRRLGVGNA